MGQRLSVLRTLAGALTGAVVGGIAVWAAAVGGGAGAAVLAAAALGGLAGWLVDRRLEWSLARLGERLERDGEESGGGAVPDGPREVARLGAAIERRLGRLRLRSVAAENERRQLEEILERMSDGVLVTGSGQVVEFVNPAFRALFAARAAAPGQTVLELSRSPVLAGFVERLEGDAGLAEERVDSEAGRTLELRGRPLGGGRVVVVARDLTEQLRLEETRRDLVANVSHELRTPLTAIRGYAENLRDGAAAEPATADRFLDRILAQCARLETLLEDLLALSRLEGGPAAPLDDRIDLAALASRALETVAAMARERRVTLGFEPAPVPAFAGSEEALERLLLNLLENAIKYNREGGSVRLALAATRHEILLEVADTGIGVPQRDLPRIFERFYRVDRGRSRDEGGTGLGLAIVKHAAQLHRGRVELESELGRGSLFRVRLPVAGKVG